MDPLLVLGNSVTSLGTHAKQHPAEPPGGCPSHASNVLARTALSTPTNPGVRVRSPHLCRRMRRPADCSMITDRAYHAANMSRNRVAVAVFIIAVTAFVTVACAASTYPPEVTAPVVVTQAVDPVTFATVE